MNNLVFSKNFVIIMYRGITMKKHFIPICFLLFILVSCGKTQERICFIEEENRFDDSIVLVFG